MWKLRSSKSDAKVFSTGPDFFGRFGEFGGKYVAETLMPALDELEKAYAKLSKNSAFNDELKYYAKHYVGRPTPLYEAKNLSKIL